jgi:hypothetical protein
LKKVRITAPVPAQIHNPFPVAAILEKPDLHSIGRFIPRSGLLKGGSFDEARGRD